MKQLTRSEFNKDGTTYKSVTSPSNDDVTQITDIAVKNEHLAYSTDGDTFTALTDEVQVVDDISTIYASENALPTNDVATGTVACALHNGVLPMTLYKFNGTSWDEIDQVRAGVLYQDKATGLIYVFKSTSPYFDATSYTDTLQLTNGAAFTNKTYVDGLAQAGTEARQQLAQDIAAKYTKPTTGIPKTDLASGVQTSLGKADSALQSINSSDVTTALGYTPYNSNNPSGYTKVEASSTNGNIKIDNVETTVYTLPNNVATTSDVNAKYTKPSGGIPSTDMTSAVQTSLGKADSALQSISSSDVTTALGYTPYNSTNPSGYTKVESSSTNGNIKINGNETTVYTLPNTVASTSDVTAVSNRVTTIEGEIPSQASSSNQLADKNFVNSSINALAAYYITKNAAGDPFATKAELTAATTFYSGGVARVPTTNDYCIVLADESKQSSTGVDPTTRYSYQGSQWEYQYTINDTPLTSAQLAALNSGITSSLVTQIGTNTTAISGKQDEIDSSHKLSADLVDDTSATNKFVTSTDITSWNGKMNATDPVGTGAFSFNRKANTTTGGNSFTEGYNTTASGSFSHAEGNQTIASGDFASHAEGNRTTASGEYGSHAEGNQTIASGNYSHAEGSNTTAQRRAQHVFGECNVLDTAGTTTTRGNYVEIVGNGASVSARSNARTLDWSGNEVLAGTLKTTGFIDGNNATYKLVMPDSTSWTADKTIATTDQIPSAITSINGLSGGSLTSPLVIKGGDAVTAAKLALDQTASGQITDGSTATLFGFLSNNATTLTVGGNSYALNLRGSGTRPQYKGNDMALYSDVPTALPVDYVTSAPSAANTTGLKVALLDSEPATKYDGWIYLIKE